MFLCSPLTEQSINDSGDFLYLRYFAQKVPVDQMLGTWVLVEFHRYVPVHHNQESITETQVYPADSAVELLEIRSDSTILFLKVADTICRSASRTNISDSRDSTYTRIFWSFSSSCQELSKINDLRDAYGFYGYNVCIIDSFMVLYCDAPYSSLTIGLLRVANPIKTELKKINLRAIGGDSGKEPPFEWVEYEAGNLLNISSDEAFEEMWPEKLVKTDDAGSRNYFNQGPGLKDMFWSSHGRQQKSIGEMLEKMKAGIDDASESGKLSDDMAEALKKKLDEITFFT
jgi:hypothetical protein